jgi:hypothetical protein
MTEKDWTFPDAHFLSYVLAPTDGHAAPLYIVLNDGAEAIPFVLPTVSGLVHWQLMLSTLKQSIDQPPPLAPGDKQEASPHAVLVFGGTR